jgi:hypothetical protein
MRCCRVHKVLVKNELGNFCYVLNTDVHKLLDSNNANARTEYWCTQPRPAGPLSPTTPKVDSLFVIVCRQTDVHCCWSTQSKKLYLQRIISDMVSPIERHFPAGLQYIYRRIQWILYLQFWSSIMYIYWWWTSHFSPTLYIVSAKVKSLIRAVHLIRLSSYAWLYVIFRR